VARAGGISVVAFSSVSSVAGSGTYLMSFLPNRNLGGLPLPREVIASQPSIRSPSTAASSRKRP
jgi:hypothetical protein